MEKKYLELPPEGLASIMDRQTRKPFPLPSLEFPSEVKWKEGDCLPYYSPDDIKLVGYQSHPVIKAPLSN